MASDGLLAETPVTLEALGAKALEAAEAVSQTERQLEMIRRTVNGTARYWVGEAADLHRKLFEEQQNAAAEILARLRDYPASLRKTGNDQRADDSGSGAAGGRMSGDLID